MSPWDAEAIPDGDLVFRRVYRGYFENSGKVKPKAFANLGNGMSVYWEKYCTPQDVRSKGQVLADTAVLSMRADKIRGIPGQELVHTPTDDERAHSDVVGEKDPGVRVLFTRIYTLEVPLDTPPQ